MHKIDMDSFSLDQFVFISSQNMLTCMQISNDWYNYYKIIKRNWGVQLPVDGGKYETCPQ